MDCLFNEFIFFLPYFTECSSSLLKSKVVNGKEVKDGQFKFLASLRLYKKHFCGGTLITRKYVVTAGRCVSFIRSNAKPNLEAAGVLLGTNDLIKDGKIYGIKNLEHSNKFDPSNPITTSGYDIGLILVGLLITFVLLTELIDSKRLM